MGAHSLLNQVLSFLFTALIASLVYHHYKKTRFAPHQKYRTFWPRFWTGSVDSLILWPVTGILPFLLSEPMPGVLTAILWFTFNFTWHTYSIVLHAKRGQTVGKIACKVKVVDFTTEGPIGFKQAILRDSIPLAVSVPLFIYETFLIMSGKLNLSQYVQGKATPVSDPAFWLLISIPMLWFIAEALTMLTNEKRRAIHDLIAGTVVIRTNVLDETSA